MVTKDNMFNSIYRIYHSWRELARDNGDYLAGLRHSIPVLSYEHNSQLQKDFDEAMTALKEAFKSVGGIDSVAACTISYDDKSDDDIHYEQTTMDLRKAICAEVYQILFDNDFVWTESNGTGIWVSTAGIFAYADLESITSACSEECLEQVLTSAGKTFNICVDKRVDEFDDEEKFFFTLKLINDK